MLLCGEWFEAGCTLVCTKGDHLSQDHISDRSRYA